MTGYVHALPALKRARRAADNARKLREEVGEALNFAQQYVLGSPGSSPAASALRRYDEEERRRFE